MTHHHHPGHVHPSPQLGASVLRLSVVQRLGLVAVLALALWAAVVAVVLS
jgi:hypothetical protein